MLLIIAVLFTTILSSLSFANLEQSFFLHKEASYWVRKQKSLQVAHATLNTEASRLLAGKIPKGASIIYQDCGITYYRLEVQGVHKSTKTAIIATIAKVDHAAKCQKPPAVQSGIKSEIRQEGGMI